MGIGVWGLGIDVWGLAESAITDRQCPIQNLKCN